MKKFSVISLLVFFLILPLTQIVGQSDTSINHGVKVRVPSKDSKKGSSYYFISLGQQLPAWYRVPMIPEFPVNMELNGKMKVKVPGWFAGIGIMKKTRSNFEVGLLGDFYKTTIPVAYAGQRSTSDWVYEQSKSTSYFTGVFNNDIDRVSEVYSVRASIRYRLSLGSFQFWGGIAPGTFSSKIYFSEDNVSEALKTYNDISLGLTYQAGISLVIKNKIGNDMLRFVFYSDFSSPEIEENIISLFQPGWKFFNSDGNYAINPVRLGFSVGIH